MKDIKFERELKVLLNEIRSYGIEHTQYGQNINDILENKNLHIEFYINVHKGFYLAQKRCILLLKQILLEKKRYKKDLKIIRQERNQEKSKELVDKIYKVQYQEYSLRKAMDAIAWQLFGYDLSRMRRLYYGQELIDITDSNLDSEIYYVDNHMSKKPEDFVLISDLTSFIQIGDMVIMQPDSGLSSVELKEGEINSKVLGMLNEFTRVDCPYYLSQRLENESPKFKEQFMRDIKQLKRSYQVMDTLNKGEGEDLASGMKVKLYDEEIVLQTYSDVVEKLLNECDKKGYAISVIEGCLLVGVYKNGRFPSEVFNIWAKSLEIEMPIVDLRQSMYDPLAYPIYLQPFSDKHIIDIILGNKIVKFTIDIEKWLQTLKKENIDYRWMSKKETARANGKLKGKMGIFDLNGKGIELRSKNGMIQHLGSGVFSRMFTSLNTPSAIKKYLIEVFNKTDEIEIQSNEDKETKA